MVWTVVFKYSKEQIWKQITTEANMAKIEDELCLNIAKNKSESKSQLMDAGSFGRGSCV